MIFFVCLYFVNLSGEALTCNCAHQFCSGTEYCPTSEDLKHFGQWGFGPNPVCGNTVYYTGPRKWRLFLQCTSAENTHDKNALLGPIRSHYFHWKLVEVVWWIIHPVCSHVLTVPSSKGCHEPSECGWSFHPYRSYTTCCSTDLCNWEMSITQHTSLNKDQSVTPLLSFFTFYI